MIDHQLTLRFLLSYTNCRCLESFDISIIPMSMVYASITAHSECDFYHYSRVEAYSPLKVLLGLLKLLCFYEISAINVQLDSRVINASNV